MTVKIFGGSTIAMATLALALAGAAPSQAKHKTHRAPKAEAEKHKCGGKNGCPAAGKAEEKSGKPEEKSAEKPADAKATDGK